MDLAAVAAIEVATVTALLQVRPMVRMAALSFRHFQLRLRSEAVRAVVEIEAEGTVEVEAVQEVLAHLRQLQRRMQLQMMAEMMLQARLPEPPATAVADSRR